LAVDSVCSGSRTATTPALIWLMVTQSAADGLVEEPAAVELADVEADVTGAAAETDAAADVADAVGVELDDELDEVQPAMRAPLAASTARAESDERRDIFRNLHGSGTERCISRESDSTEGGIGWMPYILERMDYSWSRHKYWCNVNPDKVPSELFREHIYAVLSSRSVLLFPGIL